MLSGGSYAQIFSKEVIIHSIVHYGFGAALCGISIGNRP